MWSSESPAAPDFCGYSRRGRASIAVTFSAGLTSCRGLLTTDVRQKIMKLIFLFLASVGFCSIAHAGGSIGWDDVKARISKSDSEIIKVIETNFTVNKSGGALRLGHQFGERVGERIPPYDFDTICKATGEKYRLVIDQSDDFEFTGRYKFTWKITKKFNQTVEPTR